MNFIPRIRSAVAFPTARAIVLAQSHLQRLKAWGKRPIIRHERRYEGQPIMLLALYQKGRLRPDIVRLLRTARAQGLYILAVNTMKLQDRAEAEDLIDCYVEQPNFGRDFGSYKTGFLHFYARNWVATCPRLIMLNDSVYYSTRGLSEFLSDMMTSEIEVLGATENYEYEYHLGSFCIAMSANVLRSDKLYQYWKKYRLTDVRPAVINRGEMRLSVVLKRCVSRPSEFTALYSAHRFLIRIKDCPELQDLVIKDSRTCGHISWPRFDADGVKKLLSGRVIARQYTMGENVEISVDTPLKDLNEEVLITNRDDLARYLLRNVQQPSGDFQDFLGDTLTAIASEVFMVGSQIHQNAAILLEIGLPIVKLDGLYRGVFNNYDILRLLRKLDETQKNELSKLLIDRPFGGDTYRGWKRAAFFQGLI